jgi:hypothetical protein
VRVRWYGSLFGPILRPVMEFKVKQGLAGRKESFPLQPFVLDETFTVATFARYFVHDPIHHLYDVTGERR